MSNSIGLETNQTTAEWVWRKRQKAKIRAPTSRRARLIVFCLHNYYLPICVQLNRSESRTNVTLVLIIFYICHFIYIYIIKWPFRTSLDGGRLDQNVYHSVPSESVSPEYENSTSIGREKLFTRVFVRNIVTGRKRVYVISDPDEFEWIRFNFYLGNYCFRRSDTAAIAKRHVGEVIRIILYTSRDSSSGAGRSHSYVTVHRKTNAVRRNYAAVIWLI